MQIFVRQLSGGVTAISALPSDTIASIKCRIPETLNLSFLVPRLTFAGRDLKSSATLGDCNIKDESMLSVDLRFRGGTPMAESCPISLPESDSDRSIPQPEDEMKILSLLHPGEIQLSIKTVDGDIITIVIDPRSSIKTLKDRINAMITVPPEEQRLFHSGSQLDEERALADYQLTNKSTLLLSTSRPLQVVRQEQEQPASRKEFQIFVNNLNGRSLSVMVSASETIESLLRKIEEKTDIPAARQRIIYAGKQLVPERLVSDYGIQKESTLHLVLRLVGGDSPKRPSHQY